MNNSFVDWSVYLKQQMFHLCHVFTGLIKASGYCVQTLAHIGDFVVNSSLWTLSLLPQIIIARRCAENFCISKLLWTESPLANVSLITITAQFSVGKLSFGQMTFEPSNVVPENE